MLRSTDPFVILDAGSKNRHSEIYNRSQASEVSESFEVGQERNLWLKSLISLGRVRVLLFILFFAFLFLFVRLGYLQFIKGGDYRALAEGNRVRQISISSSRGIFFDHYGVPVVDNVPTFSLFYQARAGGLKGNEQDKVKQILGDLGLTAEQTEAVLKSSSYLPVAVKENIAYEDALALMIKIDQTPSLRIIIDPIRHYAEEMGLDHLLGYTSRINQQEKNKFLAKGYQLTERVGRLGLEENYQDDLRGIDGKKQIEVDALGRENKILAEIPPVNGKNLILGLDAGLQAQAVASLKHWAPNKAGAVVALDPQNGKIRALVSWPAFDNNSFAKGISQEDYQKIINNPLLPLFNRVISGEYPSGSTLKIILGLAGLEESVITKDSAINSVGGVWYDKWFFPDWKAGGHGFTNITKAIAESVNSFFYYLALENFDGHRGLGLDKMLKWFKIFHLGMLTNIDLKGERSGFLPSPQWKEQAKNEAWYPGDTLHLAIGQGDILVTPLQVAMYTSVIANGGTLYQPQLVEKIIDPANGQEKIIEPKVVAAGIAKNQNLQIMASAMRATITSGSGRRLNFLPVDVAGKTGTAQGSGDVMPHAWFTCFLPYPDGNLVLTIMVENGGEGSDISVPIAQDILTWYISHRLRPQNP